jgi:hypothetical protein
MSEEMERYWYSGDKDWKAFVSFDLRVIITASGICRQLWMHNLECSDGNL